MHNASDKAEQIKKLEIGKGLPWLLQKAYEILGNPILIHDMEYKVIAHNQDITTDDPIWNEYAASGTVGYGWLDFFKNECFLEAAANAKTITFLTSDKLKYNRIYGKLFNQNNIQVGCACITACNQPFAEDAPILFEAVCAAFSKELGRDKFYDEYGQAYLEKLMDELIAGISDKELYTAHVESIYMHLKANLYLAAVDIGQCDPTYARLAYFRDLLKETQPEYTYAIHGDKILIIIGTDDTSLYTEQDLAPLYRLFREHNLYAGVSRSFENLFELQKYYQQAVSALHKGLAASGQHVFLYEQFNR